MLSKVLFPAFASIALPVGLGSLIGLTASLGWYALAALLPPVFVRLGWYGAVALVPHIQQVTTTFDPLNVVGNTVLGGVVAYLIRVNNQQSESAAKRDDAMMLRYDTRLGEMVKSQNDMAAALISLKSTLDQHNNIEDLIDQHIEGRRKK